MECRNFETGGATLHSAIIGQQGGLAGGFVRSWTIISRYVKVAWDVGGREEKCMKLLWRIRTLRRIII